MSPALQGKLKQTSFFNFLVAMMGKSNMDIEKNEHLQWMNMSLPSSQHAVEREHENRHQGSFSKSGTLIKDSGKRMQDEGSKCNALCMCFPCFGFGKAKPVNARKGGIKMDHSVNHVMPSTFSLENFKLNSTQGEGIVIQENNREDDSFSSYFDLPSIVLKCTGDDA
ncbi:hypothetical protein JHK82_024039 [Glycine max]|nr:hypothetical protein JHK82_024039 [Glycine max]